MRKLRSLLKNRKAATAIEYGLIAAFIAIAAVTALRGMGTQLNSAFSNVNQALTDN